jgi:predicted HicB family RNase H-like nuclease
MNNIMTIGDYRALVQYDPDIDMFRGEFIDLNGGADFYASDVGSLQHEGEISLRVFLEMCREDGADPLRRFSGKFDVRISPNLHADIAAAARTSGKSLNQWVSDALERAAFM